MMVIHDTAKMTPDKIRDADYHQLCGLIDIGHQQAKELLAEVERRKRANPSQRHYAELMR